jgi:hypothetical protein
VSDWLVAQGLYMESQPMAETGPRHGARVGGHRGHARRGGAALAGEPGDKV